MTELYGVIGDPIAHSLSALMHNRALALAKLDAVYLPFHVPSTELGAFVDAARRWPCHGFNVTIPHKRSIIPLLDEISQEAHQIGAVNTVTSREGRLLGTNTDATGYLRSLREEADFDPKACTVVILGAGGAAHAVCYGLLEAGVDKIIICNRTAAHAQALAQHFAAGYSNRIEVKPWQEGAMREAFHQSQLLINSTSVGLNGTAFEALPLDALPQESLVSDLVYRPRQTPLLKSAASRGLRTLEGLGMLVFQGAASFEIWTGITPDVKAMFNVLTEALEQSDNKTN